MKKYTIPLFVCLYLFSTCSISAQSVQSDSLFANGVSLYKNGKFEEAIKCFSICDSLDMSDSELSEERKSYSKMWIASSFYKLGQEKIAKSVSLKYYKYPPIDRRKTIKSDSLATVADVLFEKEQYEDALRNLIACAKIEKDSLGDNSLWYINSITECGYLCFNMGNYEDAISYGEIAKRISSQVCGINSEEHIETLSNLIIYYREIEEYNVAKKLINELEKIKDSISYDSEEERANAIMELAGYYEAIEDIDEAVRLINKANTTGEQNSEARLDRKIRLFNDFIKIKKYEDAIKVGTEIYNSWWNRVSQSDSSCVFHGIILARLADCYSYLGNNLKAIELCEKALDLYNKPTLNDENKVGVYIRLVNCYNNLRLSDEANKFKQLISNVLKNNYIEEEQAEYYHQQAIKEHELGNDKIAFFLTKISLDILDSLSINQIPLYAICKHDAGMFALMGFKDTMNFINNMEEAINLKKKIYGISEEYYWSIECYGNGLKYLAELEDFPKNIELYEKALCLYERIPNSELIDGYRTTLNNLACSYGNSVNIYKAIELEEKLLSIEITHEIGDTLLTLSNLADFYKDIDNDKALQYAQIVLNARINSTTPNDDGIRISHHRLAAIYCRAEKYDNAIYHMKIARHLADSLYGISSVQYATSTQNLGAYFFLKGDTKNALNYMKEAYYNISGDKRDCANNIAEIYRNLNELDSCYIYKKEAWELSCSEFICNIYNMSKENRFNYILTDKNYGMIVSPVRIILDDVDNPKLYRLAFDSALFSKDILKSSMNDKALKSYNLDAFEEIKNLLEDGEVAIEIWEDKHKTEDDFDNYLLAFLIRRNYETPIIVKISKDKINRTFRNEYPTTRNNLPLYDNIWHELIESAKIQNGERIYLSLDGILSKFPVENIFGYDFEYVSDKYDIIRLTSTKEIKNSKNNEKFDYKNAVLYGGLKYDSDTHNIINESIAINDGKRSIKDNIFEEMSDSVYSNLRSTTNYLPWSQIEVDSVTYLLNHFIGKENVKPYKGDQGVEESFKALSGKSPSIIHIATHGYIGLSEEVMWSWWDLYQYFMENTGLLFSGVLNTSTINKDSIIVEDGILRCSEISLLDLNNTKLLILSACRTGLGYTQIDTSLLNAFKASGVGSVMMTLGDVDDSACYYLMINFYQFLMSGYTIRESFKLAQKVLRNSEVFGDFSYWGYFVLID